MRNESARRRLTRLVAYGLFTLLILPTAANARRAEPWQGLPIHFEPNRGQLSAGVDFVARGPGYMLWLARGEAIVGMPRTSDAKGGFDLVRMRVEGSRPAPDAHGEAPLEGVAHVMRGSDPAAWQTDIPLFARARYRQVLPGVDWVFYGTPGLIEHDLVLAPGTPTDRVALRFDGSQSLRIDAAGDLVVATPGGAFRLKRPVVYQHHDGKRQSVDGAYRLDGSERVAFEIGAYDESRALVIDPIIEYSTFYGGSNAEAGFDIAVNAQGEAYIAGTTTSANLPTTTGAYDEVGRVGGFFDPGDAFVAKFSDDGTALLWATYLSGRALDQLFGLALTDTGEVLVIGDTESTDDPLTAGIDEAYPLVGPLQSAYGGSGDLVVTKLSADGSSIVFSTYLGGNDTDRAENELDKPSIGVDSLGRAALSVVSRSTDFHTVASCDLPSPGPYHVRLAADGSQIDQCVGIGGDAFVFLRDLVVDTGDRALVVGYTGDLNVVTTSGVFSETRIDVEDMILSRTNSAGSAIETGTYFGGTGDDFANGVALGNDGHIYITGRSSSADYPITIGGAPGGLAVATKLDDAMTGAVYSVTLGFFEGLAIAVDSVDRATIVGTDNQDAAFVHLDAAGFQMFETFWGGLFPDFANAVALDSLGHAYVTGETRSSGFPGDTVQNPSPFQGSLSGNADAFVVKLLRDDPVAVPMLPGGPWLLGAALSAIGVWQARVRGQRPA